MKIIATSPPQLYEGDVLLRVYQNQEGDDSLFYFDLSKRIGLFAEIESGNRFTSEHPQGVREVIKKTIEKLKNTNLTFQLSNEWERSSQFYSWFDTCFRKFEEGVL